MRFLIGLSALSLLLVFVAAGYQPPVLVRAEKAVFQNRDLDLTATLETRDAEIEKRNFWDWLERNQGLVAAGLNFAGNFVKRQDLTATLETRDAEIEKRNFWDWLERNQGLVAAGLNFAGNFVKRQDAAAEEKERDLEALRRALLVS